MRIPLEDTYGASIYGDNSETQSSYIKTEGEPMFGPDGKIYILLSDGRRFAMQGSYTYSEERSYTSGSWDDSKDNIQTSYTSRTHEERRRVEKTYGENFETSSERIRYSRDVDRVRRSTGHMGPQSSLSEHFLSDFDKSNGDYQVPTCEAARCVVLRCVIGPLLKDQEVSLGITGKWVNSCRNVGTNFYKFG